MNKQTLIWTLIVAVPAGLAALATGYVYHDTGRLPFQKPAETVSAPAETTAAVPDQTAGKGAEAPADQAEATQTAGSQDQPADQTPAKGPSFDVVGVEPTGETVVAGRSDAGAIVALTANGKVVGKSIANEAGEWTIILDAPLKPGDYDVGLEVHDEAGTSLEKSDQHLAVSVPEDGKEQPLVVLNTPDGPSDILQKPETGGQMAQTEGEPAAEPQETAVASADQPAGEAKPAAPEQQDTATAGSEPAVEDSTQTAETGAPKASAAPGTGQDRQTAALAVQEEPAGSGTGSATADTASAAVAPAGNGTEQEPKAGPSAPTVTVEAVESEKDKVFVAGTGEPGSSVRVYVGEDFQGEAKVNSSGKWLVQGDKNVAEGNVEVRADLIGKDGNTVDARAAVTFEKEQNQQIVLTKVVATGASGGSDGQGAEVQKSLPVVIIRKGDNLWRISRRLYGDGVRYTTIYQANQDQIRDPDLIYPGQVFLTPEGDLNWPKSPADNG